MRMVVIQPLSPLPMNAEQAFWPPKPHELRFLLTADLHVAREQEQHFGAAETNAFYRQMTITEGNQTSAPTRLAGGRLECQTTKHLTRCRSGVSAGLQR